MLIGYARISTNDQNLNLQTKALYLAGCEKIFTEKFSGLKRKRPILVQTLKYAKSGDTIVVWSLDRLSRSLKDLKIIIDKLENKNIFLKSIQESINTSSHSGKFIINIFGAVAEFENSLMRKRTLAGLEVAKEEGRKGGRPKALNLAQKNLLIKLFHEKKHTIFEICKIMGISKPTVYKYIKLDEIKS